MSKIDEFDVELVRMLHPGLIENDDDARNVAEWNNSLFYGLHEIIENHKPNALPLMK